MENLPSSSRNSNAMGKSVLLCASIGAAVLGQGCMTAAAVSYRLGWTGKPRWEAMVLPYAIVFGPEVSMFLGGPMLAATAGGDRDGEALDSPPGWAFAWTGLGVLFLGLDYGLSRLAAPDLFRETRDDRPLIDRLREGKGPD